MHVLLFWGVDLAVAESSSSMREILLAFFHTSLSLGFELLDLKFFAEIFFYIFKWLLRKHTFKSNIISKSYSEPSQTSNMEPINFLACLVYLILKPLFCITHPLALRFSSLWKYYDIARYVHRLILVWSWQKYRFGRVCRFILCYFLEFYL